MPNIRLTMSPRTANVYHLMGRDENALSYGLGHLMVVDPQFMIAFLKKGKVQGKAYRGCTSDFQVHLQEQIGAGVSGRRDVVLEAGGSRRLRVVIECKIGKGTPDACQLLRYTVGCDCGKHRKENLEEINQMWGKHQDKYIIPLTRDGLSPEVFSDVSSKLSGSGIELREMRWAQVLEIALRRLKQENLSSRSRIFVQDFVNFFKECYEMKSYQAEVMVKKDDLLNAQRVFLEGFMYVGGRKDIELPLYFAPEFTQQCVGKVAGVQQRGIHYVSRVIRVLHATVAQLKNDAETIVDAQIRNDKLWPHWLLGLRAIADRARNEGWSDGDKSLLYFLSKPIKLPHVVVTGSDQIPPGYSTTMIALLALRNLKRNATPEPQARGKLTPALPSLFRAPRLPTCPHR